MFDVNKFHFGAIKAHSELFERAAIIIFGFKLATGSLNYEATIST
jgi:hypothetical protein